MMLNKLVLSDDIFFNVQTHSDIDTGDFVCVKFFSGQRDRSFFVEVKTKEVNLMNGKKINLDVIPKNTKIKMATVIVSANAKNDFYFN